MLSKLWQLIKEEPANFSEVVRTGMLLLVLFGLPIGTEQQAGLLIFTSAVLTWLTRRNVKPIVK